MAEPRSTSDRIADTVGRLENDTDAWVTSTISERPWLAPLSFLWHEGKLQFATDSTAPTVRNLRAIPAVRVALGHTRDVVIVQGHAAVSSSADLTEDEVAAYQTKHGSDPRTWADTVIQVRPARILAWREENELSGRLLMTAGRWLR